MNEDETDRAAWTLIDELARLARRTGPQRPSIAMLRWEEDREELSFPWPYRTDGRMNHWYWKAVDRVELDK